MVQQHIAGNSQNTERTPPATGEIPQKSGASLQASDANLKAIETILQTTGTLPQATDESPNESMGILSARQMETAPEETKEAGGSESAEASMDAQKEEMVRLNQGSKTRLKVGRGSARSKRTMKGTG